MTRAKRRLVLSATEPFLAPPRHVVVAARAALRRRACGRRHDRRCDPRRQIAVPPRLRGAAAARAAGARHLDRGRSCRCRSRSRLRVATSSPRERSRAGERATTACARSDARSIVLLEWAGSGAVAASIADAGRGRGGASSASPPRQVERRAAAILRSSARPRASSPAPHIRWSGNEVSVSDDGEVLRIDRLVRLDGGLQGRPGGCSTTSCSHAPEGLDPYRAQLLRYRAMRSRAPSPAKPCAAPSSPGTGRVVEVVVSAALHGKKPHFPGLDRAIGVASG